MTPYPLMWPDHIPRSKTRGKSQFRTELNPAIKNVQGSLQSFANDSGRKVEGIVISSNVTLGATSPTDPGVAVWFTWDGLQVCIPVDRYDRVQDNLQAIYHIIEARLVELRHGTLALVRASFMGFKALPPAKDKRSWREVLGFSATQQVGADQIKAAYHSLAKQHHPDAGGNPERMAEINAAWEEAMKSL